MRRNNRTVRHRRVNCGPDHCPNISVATENLRRMRFIVAYRFGVSIESPLISISVQISYLILNETENVTTPYSIRSSLSHVPRLIVTYSEIFVQ